MRQRTYAVVAVAMFVLGAGTAGALETVVIRSLESGQVVGVQFNPKELTVKKTVLWGHAKGVASDTPTLDFLGGEPQTLDVELLFDTFDISASVYEIYVRPLEVFARVDPALKRPPLVQFAWGNGFVFRGVVSSVETKYTLFLPDGTPCRATVNLKLKEASRALSKKGGDSGQVLTCQVDADCPAGEGCFNGACAPAPQ